MISFGKVVHFCLNIVKRVISVMIKVVKIHECLLSMLCHFV